MSAADPLVELNAVRKVFGSGSAAVVALDGVDLVVAGGTVTGLLGPSGSGKSTLLNVIACILEPDGGVLRLAGETVWEGTWRRRDLRALRREKIGFIFQFHNLLPFLDARDNVALAMTLAGEGVAPARGRAEALLGELGVAHRARAMPATLSGGEAQRVAIGRALANAPRIILADEPTAALDSERAGKVMDLLVAIARERGAAVIVVTHDEKIFPRLDRIVRLRDGRVESDTAARREADALPAA
ncbi:MAG: ABC transporter ATP-binding protein [Acetobacteraceae bacterium]|nr:ABC transporter ATP-binding protein [Acetobacteraceae bacterium]